MTSNFRKQLNPQYVRAQPWAVLLSSCLLAACGGGSGAEPGPVAPPTPTLTLSGVAATGKALANAPVTARCATGQGSATTGADGRYTISVERGRLPCALKVTSATGLALHSAVDGSADAVSANITPLTELVVARATGRAPLQWFETFDATAQAQVTAPALQAAVASLASALQGALDLSGVNPISDVLVAASGTAAGNALDQKLDKLQSLLTAARTTIDELSALIASTSTPATSLQTALQPAALSCKGLRSGRYVVLSPVENRPTASGVDVLDIDAIALTARNVEEVNTTAQPIVDNGGCQYGLVDDGESSTRIVVAASGWMVAQDTFTSGASIGRSWVSGVVVPLQTIQLSQLAGAWNVLEYFRDPINGQTAFEPDRWQVTLDAHGKIIAAVDNTEVVGAQLVVNTAGGFNIGGSPSEPPSRMFAYQGSNGHITILLKYSTGRGFAVMTQQRLLALPALSEIGNFWDTATVSDGYASPLVDVQTTVTSVDAAIGAYTRRRTADGRIDSFTINQPQAGLRRRAANSCTINGATNNCAGIDVLPLPGTGITVYASIAPSNFFGITVDKP